MRKLANREKAVLHKMGAKKTINSGATFGDGDGRRNFGVPLGQMRYKGLFIEIKSTTHLSSIITRHILDKAQKQSLASHDLPAVVVDFGDKQFVILELNDFQDVIEDYVKVKSETQKREE